MLTKRAILSVVALLACAALAGCGGVRPEPTVPPKAHGEAAHGKKAKKPKAPSFEAETREGIVYAKVGGRKLMLDLYLPASTGSGGLPLVIWIHGGGWQKGSRAAVADKAGPLVEAGFAVASIDYRLTDDAKFPAQIRDCLAAVRFLRANAARYGLDPDRFGVWGASAGGHLAALVGTAAGRPEFNQGPNAGVSARVQAVCDWFGPADLVKLQAQMGAKPAMDHLGAESAEGRLVGGPLDKEPFRTRAVEASPITYVDASAPPFLIMHGDKDQLIPLAQSQGLHQALVAQGIDSTFETVAGAGHGFEVAPDAAKELVATVIAFFEKHLAP